jgi:hypothetical protein
MDATVHTRRDRHCAAHSLNPGSLLHVEKKKEKGDDRIKTIAEATTHTVLTVDGCNYVRCDLFAVTDLCSPSSPLNLLHYTTTRESL